MKQEGTAAAEETRRPAFEEEDTDGFETSPFDLPINVNKVRFVSPQRRANDETLERFLGEPLRECETLGELVATLQQNLGNRRLDKRFPLSTVNYTIDLDENWKSGPLPINVDIDLGKEKNTIWGLICAPTSFETPETNISIKNTDLFGNFETLSAKLGLAPGGKGWNLPVSYQLKFKKPLHFHPAQSVFVSGENLRKEDTSSQLHTHQLRAGAKFNWYNSSHTFQYIVGSRSLTPKPSAPMGLRESSGSSTKSAVQYTLEKSIPGKIASNLWLTQELAGLGGEASFYKFDLTGVFSSKLIGFFEKNKPPSGFDIQASAQSSFVVPIGGPVRAYDKCFFNERSMLFFNKTSQDVSGGDYCLAGTLKLSTVTRFGALISFFANAGTLASVSKDLTLSRNVQTMKDGARASIGVGVGTQQIQLLWGLPVLRSRGGPFSWFELRASHSF